MSKFEVSPPRWEHFIKTTDIDRDKVFNVPIGPSNDVVHYKSSNSSDDYYFAGRTYTDTFGHLFPEQLEPVYPPIDRDLNKTDHWRADALHGDLRPKTITDDGYHPAWFGGIDRMIDGGSILSIGIGPGVGEAKFSILNPGVAVYGIDLLIRERNKLEVGAAGLQLTNGDAGRIALPDNSVSGIIESQSATAWTFNPKLLYQQAREKDRVAKVGATMRITCPGDDIMITRNPDGTETVGRRFGTFRKKMDRYNLLLKALDQLGWQSRYALDADEHNCVGCVTIAAEKQH